VQDEFGLNGAAVIARRDSAEAIQRHKRKLDCLVANAPRNDDQRSYENKFVML
jgi:hypothetical protein